MKTLFLTCLIIILYPFITSDDLTTQVDNVVLKVRGQSGKITISTVTSKNNTNFTSDQVTINFSSIKEVDVNGTEVGKTGSVKHTFNNFAQLNFEVSNVTETTFKNISAFKFSFKAKDIVTSGNNFEVAVYIFKTKGKIQENETEISVNPGTVKFSWIVTKWPFCQKINPCEGPQCCVKGQIQEVGSYLDFEIEISGNKNATNTQKNVYDFGNSTLVLNDYVINDGSNNQTKMPLGFPMQSIQGTKNVFTFRIPSFVNQSFYDPYVTLNNDTNTYAWIIVVSVVGVALLIGIVFGIYYFKKRSTLNQNLISK